MSREEEQEQSVSASSELRQSCAHTLLRQQQLDLFVRASWRSGDGWPSDLWKCHGLDNSVSYDERQHSGAVRRSQSSSKLTKITLHEKPIGLRGGEGIYVLNKQTNKQTSNNNNNNNNKRKRNYKFSLFFLFSFLLSFFRSFVSALAVFFFFLLFSDCLSFVCLFIWFNVSFSFFFSFFSLTLVWFVVVVVFTF